MLVAAGIYLLTHTGSDFGSIANHLARRVELDPTRGFVKHVVDKLHSFGTGQVTLFGIGALLYGALELVEGVGLWKRQRWAEWLTVIATSLLVPFELYEVARNPSVLKAGGLAVNVLIVLYLIRVVRRHER